MLILQRMNELVGDGVVLVASHRWVVEDDDAPAPRVVEAKQVNRVAAIGRELPVRQPESHEDRGARGRPLFRSGVGAIAARISLFEGSRAIPNDRNRAFEREPAQLRYSGDENLGIPRVLRQFEGSGGRPSGATRTDKTQRSHR